MDWPPRGNARSGKKPVQTFHSYLHDAAVQINGYRAGIVDPDFVIASTSDLLAHALEIKQTPSHWRRFVESAYQDLSAAKYHFDLEQDNVFGSTGTKRLADAEAKIKTILGELHVVDPHPI